MTKHFTEKKDLETRSIDQRHKSDRPKHTHTAANMTVVDELVLSQGDQTQTHHYTPDIQRDGSNTVYHRMHHSPLCWSEVFCFSFAKTLVCYYC